jgi:chromosome segregation ATPase
MTDDVSPAMQQQLQAIRDDIGEVRTELKAEIAAVRTELKAEIAAVRTELKTDLAAVRTELKGEVAEERTELAGVRAELKGEIAELRTEVRTGFAEMGAELARHDRRFDEMNSRFLVLHEDLTGKFNLLAEGFVAFRDSMEGKFAMVIKELRQTNARTTLRIDDHEVRLGRLEGGAPPGRQRRARTPPRQR